MNMYFVNVRRNRHLGAFVYAETPARAMLIYAARMEDVDNTFDAQKLNYYTCSRCLIKIVRFCKCKINSHPPVKLEIA